MDQGWVERHQDQINHEAGLPIEDLWEELDHEFRMDSSEPEIFWAGDGTGTWDIGIWVEDPTTLGWVLEP